jgi:hypothetical protein
MFGACLFGLDREDHTLATKLAGDSGNQLGIRNRSGINGNFVGSGSKQLICVLDTANATTDCHWHKYVSCGLAYDFT